MVETIFLPNDFNKIEDWEDTFDFCVDVKGRTRKGSGIVSMREKDDDDLRFVPMLWILMMNSKSTINT